MSTDPAHPDDHQEQLLVPLAAEDVAALGSDGEELAMLLAAALHDLAPLRTGGASAADLAAVIDDTTGLLERLEAVRGASLRQPMAKDVSHADLAKAMHLKSRATAQSRRRTLLNKPVSDLERWATGTVGLTGHSGPCSNRVAPGAGLSEMSSLSGRRRAAAPCTHPPTATASSYRTLGPSFARINVFMTAASPRRSGAAARLQRVVRRRTRPAPRRAAAPIGSRPPGRRRRRTSASVGPAARQSPVTAPPDWWIRIQQAVGTLASLGTLAVIVFTWLSLQQVDDEHALTREGQVTDRYNAAVGNIGDDSLDVRLGGIYALQRIMEDSPRDQPSIVNVLSTYIRNHAKKPKQGTAASTFRPVSDVQAALTALGSRDRDHDGTVRIDLGGVHLLGADLTGADLTEAYLAGADLSGAFLSGASLTNVDLVGADLSDAHLSDADLSDAYLLTANLPGANLSDADLTDTELSGANLSRAYLFDTQLSDAGLSDADVSGANLTDADLSGADLTGAHLNGANLSGADLTNAKR
ncbi:pentapeptide repeat-containing protein [Streptomyces capillispiralis]|uniref:pentapeptide repeat-containing protein n=1 Tax=Streptomyces capillispiralis TaxID=68182 RepID=UPI001679399D|nr:pentapeptide repeat-containing protein [Streptomyces capillispiralis]GHE24156.1 hypothetical protein GCM10017779_71430 [Streptomyces capillispiralis]